MEKSEIHDSIVELLYSLLGAHGFQVGMDQILKVQCLLASMAAAGTLPSDVRRLCFLIAPIVCTSPAEQEAFYRLFEKQVVNQATKQVDNRDASDDPNRLIHREKIKTRLIGIASTLILLVGACAVYMRVNSVDRFDNGSIKTNPLIGTQEPKEPGIVPAIADADVVVLSPPDDAIEVTQAELTVASGDLPNEPLSGLAIFGVYSLVGSAAVLALAGLWTWRLRRAEVFLRRQTTTQKPSIIAAAKLTSEANRLFNGIELPAVARQIRQRSTVPSNRLDVDSTVEMTARQSGTFSPRFRNRSISPEYLVLIERHSPRDHMAHFVQAFLERLREEEVHFDRYWYAGDPRFCQRIEYESPFPLDVLATRHAGARLVICGNAAAFYDRFSARAANWTEVLEHWEHRTLLTSVPVTEWGYHEWQISKLGMEILPLTLEGIGEMARRSQPMVDTPRVPVMFAPRFPKLLTENVETWLSAFAPTADVIKKLDHELSCYLGRHGMLWLSSCAVYPELHWHLTLYLGQRLVPEYFSESSVVAFSRLPWLRVGWIPDWLREKLIHDLSSDQMERVRFEIDAILFRAVRGDAGDSGSLEIAWNNRSLLARIGDRISRNLRKDSVDDQLTHDYVFASFVETERTSALAYRVPQQIGQWLMRQMKPQPKRSLPAKLIRVVAAICLIIGSAFVGLIALKPSDIVVRTPSRLDNSIAGKGYGQDLKLAIDSAITDLQESRIEDFVRNMFPVGELGYIEAQGSLNQVVEQFETGQSTKNGEKIKPSVLADLKAVQEFLLNGGQPVWAEKKTVASFTLQRQVRFTAPLAPPPAPPQLVPAAKADGPATKFVLTSFRSPASQEEKLPDNSQSKSDSAAKDKQDKQGSKTGYAPGGTLQDSQLPDQYTVTIRFQLVSSSWRFFDAADQLRRVQRSIIRQSGAQTTWQP